MVGFQRVGVGGAEGGGELFGGAQEVGADALGGEVEAAGGWMGMLDDGKV